MLFITRHHADMAYLALLRLFLSSLTLFFNFLHFFVTFRVIISKLIFAQTAKFRRTRCFRDVWSLVLLPDTFFKVLWWEIMPFSRRTELLTPNQAISTGIRANFVRRTGKLHHRAWFNIWADRQPTNVCSSLNTPGPTLSLSRWL